MTIKVEAEQNGEETGERWLSFAVARPEVLRQWEARLREDGAPLDTLDLSDEQCVLLAAADTAMHGAPGWWLDGLGQAVRAPAKVRGARRTPRWILDHWYRSDVRRAVAQELRKWMLPVPGTPAGWPEAVKRWRQRGINWVQVLWTVRQCGPSALLAAYEAWGEDEWDRNWASLLAEARPALWMLLVLPWMDRVIQAEVGHETVQALSRQVRELQWEARAVKERHEKATSRVRELLAESEQLRAELEARERRIRELEEELAEERRSWAVVLRELRAATRATRAGGRAEKPLAGKRVVIVGGDPVAAGAIALVESLGGEAEFCPGFSEEARVEEAVSAADLVVAVAAYLSHKHSDRIKAGVARGNKARVIWVNRTGLTAVRRAVERAIQERGQVSRVGDESACR